MPVSGFQSTWMSSPDSELFLGGGAHGFFHRFDYQFALDALFLAKGFDVLCDARTHVFSLRVWRLLTPICFAGRAQPIRLLF